MSSYIAVLSIVLILGFCIEISRGCHWNATLVIGRNVRTVPLDGVFWLLIFVTLTLYGGLRYNVGTDYESYCTMFTDICDDWFKNRYTGTEQGYVWLNRIVSLFTEEPQVIIFITNMIICVFGVTTLRRYCKCIPFGLVVYFTTLYYFSFNIIRQGMAANMVFLAIGLAADGKMKRAWFWVIAAGFFHQTAWLLMIPLLFLMKRRYKLPVYLAVFGIAALATLFRDTVTIQLISRIYPSMLNFADAYQYEFSPVQVALCALYLLLCLMYISPMLEKKKENILYVNFALFTFGVYLLLFWIPMWSRLNLYVIGLYALIVPEAVSCEKDRRMRWLYYGGLMLMLVFFFFGPSILSGTDWYYGTYFDKLRELELEKIIP